VGDAVGGHDGAGAIRAAAAVYEDDAGVLVVEDGQRFLDGSRIGRLHAVHRNADKPHTGGFDHGLFTCRLVSLTEIDYGFNSHFCKGMEAFIGGLSTAIDVLVDDMEVADAGRRLNLLGVTGCCEKDCRHEHETATAEKLRETLGDLHDFILLLT
jgi:hypothetical protein